MVAGDVCTSLEKLRETLEMLGAKFKCVFYCVGNHELWCPKAAEGKVVPADSLAKLLRVLEVAEAAGAVVSAALLGGDLAIAPLHSWYHAAFADGASPEEPHFACRALPNGRAAGMDVGCKWPPCLPDYRVQP